MGCVCVGGFDMPEMAGTLSNGHVLAKDSDVANNNVQRPTITDGSSDWIDADLVAEAVGEDPSSIRDVVVKAAVADGDNYCSCMWRVQATAGDKPVSIIVKAPPRGELMQDFVTRLGFFTKETRMLKVKPTAQWYVCSYEHGFLDKRH
ncbi:uncharacterized protein LOC127750843 isoform X1 [Frankliniella occidentalis]|uniref:Uncharacterized protein LOC127750843 isoform X1 n=2 Tax=Frankliniella occidentalis TaxID=133901 RepID=A0A9C6X551_FRAOC|nr:uncharacterized protein LOC127750843 isoform X1 [Frankliniella occidentalis]